MEFLIREVPLRGLVDEIMLNLRPSVHEDGRHLNFNPGLSVSLICTAEFMLGKSHPVVDGRVSGESFSLIYFRGIRELPLRFDQTEQSIYDLIDLLLLPGEVKGDANTRQIDNIIIDVLNYRILSFGCTLTTFICESRYILSSMRDDAANSRRPEISFKGLRSK